MDDLAQSWSKLTLSEREGPGCCLTNEESVKEFSIAAKFLTGRALNIDAIAKTFTPLWKARNGFKIQTFGDHKILFTFESKEDVDRILSSEPWSFDKHLVVMQRYENDLPLHDLSFNKTTLWVQVHGLPARFKSFEAAGKICGAVGEVLQPSGNKVYDGGSFMRVQVTIDLNLPLCRGRLISLNGNKEVWVSFKYERLPNICYWCGRLTHADKDCELWIESEGTLRTDQREFGPNIRAPPFVASRKTVVQVPGFYAMRKKKNSHPSNASQHSQFQTGGDQGKNQESGSEQRHEEDERFEGPLNVPSMRANNEGDFSLPAKVLTSINSSVLANNEGVIPPINTEIEGELKSLNGSETEDGEINEELHRLGKIGIADLDKCNVEASEKFKEAALQHTYLAREQEKFHSSVSNQTQTKRVLPQWTRIIRSNQVRVVGQSEEITGKKRNIAELEDHLGLPSKRERASQNDDTRLFGLVEAVSQPRQ